MKNKIKLRIRLGVFVLSGLLILTAGVFYIGRQKHMFNPVFRINTLFKNVSGLQVGNKVRFSGINVGTVENIIIVNDSTVRVLMIVDKDVQRFIKKDSYVRIASEGIIGDKIATITHGSHRAMVNDNDFLSSIEPMETDEILGNLQKTGQNATIISGELAEILYDINNGNGTIARLIHDTTIAENLDEVILNLKKSSKGLNENMQAAKHNIFLRGYFKDQKRKKEKQDEDRKRKRDKNNENK